MYSHTMKRSLVFFLVLAVGLAMSFALSTGDVSAAAKAKKITLKADKTTVFVGDTAKITVKAVTPKKAKKDVKWTITAGKENAKLTNVKKTSVVVEALKAGDVTIKATAKKGKAKKSINLKILNQLKKFGITGYYAEGVDTINTVPLDENLTVCVWDPETNAFVEGTTADINGNYTALYDIDGNDKADQVEVVKFADGTKKWDAEMTWMPGAGEVVGMDDKVGAEVFGKEFRIPYGERLFSEFGLGAYSGATDWANVEKGGYWENTEADFYHQGSTDTLTMLTGFRTDLQTSGSLCVMSSSATILDWYGQRGDLTENDLALLRGNNVTQRGGTSLDQAMNMFDTLGKLGLTCEWDYKTYYDFDGDLMTSEWVQEELGKGHPILVIWNAFGAHGQVIIGYDNMGTPEAANDDVCIMMDPYDTTDQNNDGYIIVPWERLQYALLTWPNLEGEVVTTGVKYMSVWPKDPALWDATYQPTPGTPLVKTTEEKANFTKEMKLDYGCTADDIAAFYPDTELWGDPGTGLAGPATIGFEDKYNHDASPYFTSIDFYNMESSGSLHILPKFKTIQQATEWTCGTASALMNIEWFGKNEIRKNDADPGKGSKETDVSLATHRQGAKAGATSKAGMKEVFDYMSSEYGQNWTVFTNDNLDDPMGEESYIGDYCLQAGDDPGWPGLIPYLIDHGIPMMIGSDEWGGHWQVIIGYDSMGTPETPDDVLIIADPYDTTDHNQDGYVIKGFERLVYGWGAAFENRFEGTNHNDFIVAFPTEGNEEVIQTLGLN